MIFIALLIGAVLIVAAVRNSQGALATALVTDVPGYVVWGAAIFAVGAVGWIPGLKPVSRGLLALVLVVIVLNNYKAVLSGFQSAITTSEGQTPNANSGGSSSATSPGGISVNPAAVASTLQALGMGA
jgi:hypothetical protein